MSATGNTIADFDIINDQPISINIADILKLIEDYRKQKE